MYGTRVRCAWLFFFAAFWDVLSPAAATAGVVTGTMVAQSPGSGSPNALTFSLTQSGTSNEFTGIGYADAGSFARFSYDTATHALTLTGLDIRSAYVSVIFGGFSIPAIRGLVVALDTASPAYPPAGSVDAGTGAVSLAVPVTMNADFLGTPISSSVTVSFSGAFQDLGAASYRLSGNGSLSTTTGGYDIDGDFDIDLKKFRFPLVDLNGDGKADPAIRVSGDDDWHASLTPGTASFSTAFGQNGDIPLVGDFNGDGIADLVAYHAASTSQWTVTYSPDFSGTDLTVNFGSSTTSDQPFICDFNGDGLADIGVTRTGFLGSAVYVLRFSPTYGSGTEVTKTFGLSGDKKFFGDVNADGGCDIIVNRSGNQNYATYSPDWGTGTDFSAGFGLSGDIPVLADYDGDGLMDLAVARDTGTSTLWFVKYSSGGYSTTNVSTFLSLTGGYPVVDDYNGDGRADPALYKDGSFYISFSPTFYGFNRIEALGADVDAKLQNPTSLGGAVGK